LLIEGATSVHGPYASAANVKSTAAPPPSPGRPLPRGDLLMLDAWTKISVFTKLKLTSCARPDHRAGRFDLVDHMSAAPRLFPACSALVVLKRPLRRGVDFKHEFLPAGATACKLSCI
jgi:hypothetical protein